MDRMCKHCLYGCFKSASVPGAFLWKGVCTATKRPHYIEQGWKCSCGKFEPRPSLAPGKEVTNETEMGCDAEA